MWVRNRVEISGVITVLFDGMKCTEDTLILKDK